MDVYQQTILIYIVQNEKTIKNVQASDYGAQTDS